MNYKLCVGTVSRLTKYFLLDKMPKRSQVREWKGHWTMIVKFSFPLNSLIAYKVIANLQINTKRKNIYIKNPSKKEEIINFC